MPDYRSIPRPNKQVRTVVAACLLLVAASLVFCTAFPSNPLGIERAGCFFLGSVCGLLAAWVATPTAVARVGNVFGGILMAASIFVLLVAFATRTRPAGTIALLLLMHAWPLVTSVRWLLLHRRQTAATAPVRMRRATTFQIAVNFFVQLLVAGVLLAAHDDPGREAAGWTAVDLGCGSPLAAPLALVFGAVGSVPYLMLVGGWVRGAREPPILQRAIWQFLGGICPGGDSGDASIYSTW